MLYSIINAVRSSTLTLLHGSHSLGIFAIILSIAHETACSAAIMALVLLPGLLAFSLRQAAITQSGININIIYFQSLIIQFLFELHQRVFNNRAYLSIVTMEGRIHGPISRYGNL